jgi:hypothetical protein
LLDDDLLATDIEAHDFVIGEGNHPSRQVRVLDCQDVRRCHGISSGERLLAELP